MAARRRESRAARTPRAPLRLLLAGPAGYGKSTLVGRLLRESGTLAEGKLAAVEASRLRLKSGDRDYLLIDAPGDHELLTNIATGATESDAALLLIDASEGMRGELRRHAFLLSLLGLKETVVAINKMDLAGYDEARFSALEAESRAYLARLDVNPRHVVPISATEGVNLTALGKETSWYGGPTLLAALAELEPAPPAANLPLRLPVEDVHKLGGRRLIAGRIESGRLAVGDRLLFSPSNKSARVKSIEVPGAAEKREAEAGESVGLTLEEPIFVERGEVASHEASPPVETNVFRARLLWLAAAPLKAEARFTLKLLAAAVPVEVQEIERVVDPADLSSAKAEAAERYAITDVILRARALLALDDFSANPRTGRFVLTDSERPVAGGTISMQGYPDQRELVTVRSTNVLEVPHGVGHRQREARAGHRGGVLWLTGLSGAGKSTLAMEVEQRLFAKGFNCYVLDGDNVRRGLNSNLGFGADDRAENIRRVGEVAALFADAGFVCITAFISPYRSDRERARRAAQGRFHEIYVRAPLALCESRDPKGLYRRARAGEIKDFTGVSAPYEAPTEPELVVDTSRGSVRECVEEIMSYIERRFASGADES